jgi:DNA-binding response OmpR family regulator
VKHARGHAGHIQVTNRRAGGDKITRIEPSSDTVLIAGPLQVRPNELALASGRPLTLPRREIRLLTAFALNENRVLSREKWAELAWGSSPGPGDRAVDHAVLGLRRRLRDALPGWDFIHTHIGMGYRFSAERSQAFHNQGTPA